MNSVILMGRLTKNPVINYSQEGMCIARFTLAVNRFKKEEADFISCVAFKKQAEFAEKYLKQGTKIVTSGRIQTGSYTNREGTKVYTTDVILNEIEFAESKKNEENKNNGFVEIPDDLDFLTP